MSVSTAQQQSTGDVFWDRRIQLVVGPKEGGEGIDLSQLRIVFRISAALISTPGTLRARVFNLADDTVRKLLSVSPPTQSAGPGGSTAIAPALAELSKTQVILNAGYWNGPYGNIFQGTLVAVRAGRESQTDTYVDLFAQDGDAAHQQAFISGSLGAGYKPSDQGNLLMKNLNTFGVAGGKLPDNVNSTPAPRGKVFFGNTKSYFDDLARTHAFTWGIDKGHMVMIPYDDYRGGGQAIELNSATGMLDRPELTNQGVTVKSLLNPALTWGTRVHINNRVLQANNVSGRNIINQPSEFNFNYNGGGQANWLAATAADGFYKVLLCDHSGDTRGNEWYTTLICMALDATVTPMTAQNMVPPP